MDGSAQDDMPEGGTERTSMVLLRRLMLSRWRSLKSMPRMRCMGRSSTASHGIENRQPLISATPEYWPRTVMPPALPPMRRGPVYSRRRASSAEVSEAVFTREKGEQVSMCTFMGTPSMVNIFIKCDFGTRWPSVTGATAKAPRETGRQPRSRSGGGTGRDDNASRAASRTGARRAVSSGEGQVEPEAEARRTAAVAAAQTWLRRRRRRVARSGRADEGGEGAAARTEGAAGVRGVAGSGSTSVAGGGEEPRRRLCSGLGGLDAEGAGSTA